MSKLPPLNFPEFKLRTRTSSEREEIFDPARKKFVALTPEEWVRQHMIAYFTEWLAVPVSMIAVEKGIRVNSLYKRFDIVVFRGSKPLMLVECKSPGVVITQSVMDQAGRYNITLDVPYLCVSNGLTHLFCKKNEHDTSWQFLKEIPAYSEL